MNKSQAILKLFLTEKENKIKPEPINISGEAGKAYSLDNVKLVTFDYMDYDIKKDILQSPPTYLIYFKDNRFITNFNASNLTIDNALVRLYAIDSLFNKYPIGSDGIIDNKLKTDLLKLINKYKTEDDKLEQDAKNKVNQVTGMDALKGFYDLTVLNNFAYSNQSNPNLTDKIYVIDYDNQDFHLLGRFTEVVSTDLALKVIKELNAVYANKKVPSVKTLIKNPKVVDITNKYSIVLI